jgi:hypothetical protein
MSVSVCHLFMATYQEVPTRRQERSRTSFEVSFPKAERTDWRRGRENVPEGKRKDVIMTYCRCFLLGFFCSEDGGRAGSQNGEDAVG